jgi:DNA-binding transcriptional LysR family regulator
MIGNMYDLRQLQALLAVSRAGSYTRAAEVLGYTQPAVSYQIKRLQEEVGVRLVAQTGRGARMTPAGAALVKHAETVFAAMRAAAEEMTALTAHGRAVVKIEAFQSSCATLIPQAAALLGRENPNLRLVLHQAEPAKARATVREGEADLGIVAKWDNEPVPEGEEPMSRVTLLTDRRCMVMRQDHPLASRDQIDFADLAEESWVMESFRDRFVTACRDTGFDPKIAATADDHMTIQALVTAGLGITLMNELGLQAFLQAGLVARPLMRWPRRVIYALAWPDMASVPAVATVLEAIKAAASGFKDIRQGLAGAETLPWAPNERTGGR